jgi:(p)ppGpp synthase/HD superfamily hydrolase
MKRMTTAKLTRHLTKKQSRDVRAALRFANRHLQSIKRRSGEDYAAHGFEVASVLAEQNGNGSALLSVAVLHDVLVHEKGLELLRVSPLKRKERTLVRKMHGLRRLHIDASTHDLGLVIDAFTEETSLLPLRMAHRVNDVRNIHRFGKRLQRQIAHETLHMYAAIAGRLGMHAWRYEMEDACFRILQPKHVNQLEAKFTECRELDRQSLKQTRRFLERKIREGGITCSTDERIKGLYSTYRKMVIKNRAFHELTDRLAIRIVVPDLMDCYRALAIVHQFMHPIPGKLKDYIGAPKENGYQSIHTVVYPLPGVTEQPIEIQIRTAEMHRACEYGTASHNTYKQSMYALRSNAARVNLFRNLESLRAEARSPKQFEQALRRYFRDDHVAIFDQKNNLYHLKKPSTALDFVFYAHPSRARRLKGVRVNGRTAPINVSLEDGDIVEAQFGRTARIKKEWLKACERPAVKAKIRTMMTA